MTPTQLIYQAWLKTPKPLTYLTEEKIFVDPTTHKHYEPEWKGECAICGGVSVGAIKTQKLLSSNYTDWAIHKSPQSDHICIACAFTMLLNVEEKRDCLFRYSFCASEERLELLNREQLRDRIINPPNPPFVLVCAVSQKKHLAIKSRVSYSCENYFCMLEEECMQVNRQAASDMIKLCEALRGIGFTKEEIRRGTIRYDRIKPFKIDAFEKIKKLLDTCIGLRQFALCLYVSQKMNEEEAICYLGLTPRMKLLPQELCSSTQYTKAEMSREVRPGTICGDKLSVSPAEPQNEQMTLGDF